MPELLGSLSRHDHAIENTTTAIQHYKPLKTSQELEFKESV